MSLEMKPCSLISIVGMERKNLAIEERGFGYWSCWSTPIHMASNVPETQYSNRAPVAIVFWIFLVRTGGARREKVAPDKALVSF